MIRLPGSLRTWSFAVVAFLCGCQPNIGDACTQHTDCSATGNRLCEPNLPGGYCTVFNCEPGGCPGEAACVAYGIAPSVKPECAVQQSQRLERTFCMKRCSTDADCRGGYACVNLDPDPNNRDQKDKDATYIGAAVIDTDRGTRVCTVPLSDPAQLATATELGDNSAQVCSPPDASFESRPARYDGGVAPKSDAGPRTDAAPSDAAPRTDAASMTDASKTTPDAQVTP
jgi:hypothetical protein